MIKTLRGQEVDIESKVLSVSIHKPLYGAFSLSDKIISYLNKGYQIKVSLPKNKVQYISKENKHFRKEEVKSKFPGCEPWHRYWYAIDKEDGRQMVLAI